MNPKTLLGRVSAFVVVVLFLALPAFGQGSKWWQSEQYRRELGLTTEQSRRLEDVFQAAVPTLKTHKKALDQAESEFERMLERGDDGSVMDQVERVEAARAELNKSHTMMMLRMRRVLTTDQWARFTAMHQAAEREKNRSSGRGK
ncbi:MAG TPA: periplasmic heavy metal sensor [Vicinamibacterales bacterium]|nr:periplasmic heavy metal sensor [Vicinamibacterales bacterium]